MPEAGFVREVAEEVGLDVHVGHVAALVVALRGSWAADTCDPDDTWDPANPGRGQCGPSALVIQDMLGGDLVCAEVHVAGHRSGYHWWNRLATGVDVDVTRDQFRADELLTAGQIVLREPGTDPRRCIEQYRRLAARVRAALPA